MPRIRDRSVLTLAVSSAVYLLSAGQAIAVDAPSPPPPAEPPGEVPSVPAPAPVPAEVLPAPAPAPVPIPPPALAPVSAPVLGTEPLAGVSDGSMFFRSPDNAFVFFPNGRLQLDTYVFHSDNKTPKDSFLVRRARLEIAGWISGFAFFHLAGDFAAGVPASSGVPAVQSNLNTTDSFVALAPFGTIAMLQVGQYDAPFTLENRLSDKYFDFMERSITVRAFGIPDNKEMGAMVHGYDGPRRFLYSVGLFNGDGQNFKNIDNHFDWMGRGWVAPFAFTGEGPLHDVTIGGSFWTGERGNTVALPSQTTQGGFTFLSFSQFTTSMTSGMPNTPVQLRQSGRLKAFAGEINAPIAHKYGLRYELVWKESPLAAESIAANGTGTSLGGAKLRGYSMYGELSYWAIGDDTIIGDQQGLEPFPRFKKFGVSPPRNGLMLALRVEYLNEDVTEDADTAALSLGSPAVGKTKVTSYQLGVNYWRSKRFRATFNYVLNHFDRGTGATPFLAALPSAYEQEFLFRLAIAL
jgi:phosphate-selective porin